MIRPICSGTRAVAVWWAVALALALTTSLASAAQPGGSKSKSHPRIITPDQPTPTLSLDEVRVGMKGYGLSVFKGTKVEPFPVEVLSVVPNSSPKRGVIWIRCPGPRMQQSGAVQGMSGSPIYLWPDTAKAKKQRSSGNDVAENDEVENDKSKAHQLGQGGRLIGAFAFGYGFSKDCIVGVQPIGYMRELAKRADTEKDHEPEGGGAQERVKDPNPTPMGRSSTVDGPRGHGKTRGSRAGLKMLRGLQRLADRRRASDSQRLHLDALSRLFAGTLDGQHLSTGTYNNPRLPSADRNLSAHWTSPVAGGPLASGVNLSTTGGGFGRPGFKATSIRPTPSQPTTSPQFNRGAHNATQAKPLQLPMAVGSSDLAELVSPLLEPAGIMPVSANAAQLSAQPPKGVDAQTPIRPGSVLAVPLAFGDLNLAAAGTVTDVMPDGTTLGFGHPMFGQGETAVPMASGYVHFVVPLITTSFKQAGSLDILGSLVQDGSAGVAGVGQRTFHTAPVQINVTLPGQHEPRQYHYNVVNHRMLTSPIATLLAMQSMTAIQQPPIESTITMHGELAFTGERDERKLTFNEQMAGSGAAGIAFDLAPVLTMVLQNPFEDVDLERMQMNIRIEEGLNIARITDARLSKAQMKPGETTTLTVGYQPYAEARKTKTIQLKTPANLPDGDYQVIVADAQTYAGLRMRNRPFLQQPQTLNELFEMTRRQLEIERDAMYVMLQLNEPGLAVDRQAMPGLPSSKAALFGSGGSTGTSKYVRSINQTIQMPQVMKGQQHMTLRIRSKKSKKKE